MTTPIHPEALKAARARKRWTQDDLCDATRGPNKVSLPTIKRIESAKEGPYQANDRVAQTLAKALGMSVEDLGKEPTEREQLEESLRKVGYRPLRTMIDAETALAFNMVQNLYGIPIRSQIEMAPLFMTLLAEGSLAWRRARVDEIEAASDALQGFGGGHSSYVYTAWRVDEGIAAERVSIENKDLFGVDASEQAFDCGYDRSLNNPFADYLAEFAQEVGADSVSFDRDFGWKTSEGLPSYRIGSETISRLTTEDPDAEYALLRGHVRIGEIPEALLGDEDATERVTWMIDQIPAEELSERRAERESLMSLLRIDGASGAESDTSSSGGQDD